MRKIDEVCRFKAPPPNPSDEGYDYAYSMFINEKSAIVCIDLTSTDDALILKLIGVRPCFMKHKFFLVIVYQLIRLARETSKALVFDTCYPSTFAILQRYFGDAMDPPEAVLNPRVVFSNPGLTLSSVTPEYLGIESLIRFAVPTGELQLAFRGYPSADELNSQAYVDAHYSRSN
jgi:hypothetical protein